MTIKTTVTASRNLSGIISRVLCGEIVDTKAYRYTARDTGDAVRVIRCPLAALGTTAALDGWQTVAVIA